MLRMLVSLALSVGSSLLPVSPTKPPRPELPTGSVCAQSLNPQFLVVAGGGEPKNTEIALEKNVLYFQRTLQTMGRDPATASIYFANGSEGEPSVRFLDEQRQQQFKPPSIPNLLGSASWLNVQNWFGQNAKTNQPLFFYFTGHGIKNSGNVNNNSLLLWGNELLSVQRLAGIFDTLPPEKPIVTVMSQCYAGSFANLIYEGGDPRRPVAGQSRCGFFATIKTLPSVGCTPEVNEADYRDYSSSFFAGLSGRNRIGEPVASADFDQDGRVSYAEAHAFAKVDGITTDLPLSTVEAWLQERTSRREQTRILSLPLQQWLEIARPDRRYVVAQLAQRLNFDLTQSFIANSNRAALPPPPALPGIVQTRLAMELITIGTEQQLTTQADPERIKILDQLNTCEAGSW